MNMDRVYRRRCSGDIPLFFCSEFRDTYVFEELLHEGELDIVGHRTRVSRVYVLFVRRRQLLSLLAFAAMTEH